MSLPAEVTMLGNIAATAVIGWLLLQSYRYVTSKSRALGRIAAAGILARILIGLTLFWISYLQSPIGASLHTGNGFWDVAPDAQGYYELAVSTASGEHRSDEVIPSSLFVTVLALWMSVVGTSPASAFLLNVALYAALLVLVVFYYRPVNDWRRDLPCLLGVGAYSFSPALLLHSSQPLKDAFSSTFVATACLGVLGLRTLIYTEREPTADRSLWTAVAVLVVATFCMAGVRWYYAVMMICAVAVVLSLFAIRGRSTPWQPYLRGCATVLGAMAVAFATGLGQAERSALNAAVFGASVHDVVENARIGFISSAGATNFGEMGTEHAISVGTAFMFIPLSIISAVSDVTVQGGRGLLPIVDADTIFQDVAIVSIMAVLWTRRRVIGTRLPGVLFCLVLAVTSALLIAYIVTNFGTQWRLRLLATVPLWFVGVAISPTRQIANVRESECAGDLVAAEGASTNRASA